MSLGFSADMLQGAPGYAAEELTGLAEEDAGDEAAWAEEDTSPDAEPGGVLDAAPAVTAASVTERATEVGASSPP